MNEEFCGELLKSIVLIFIAFFSGIGEAFILSLLFSLLFPSMNFWVF